MKSYSYVTEELTALHEDPFGGGEGVHEHIWRIEARFHLIIGVDRRPLKARLRRVLDSIPRDGDKLPGRLATEEALALHVCRAMGPECIGCAISRKEGFGVEFWT